MTQVRRISNETEGRACRAREIFLLDTNTWQLKRRIKLGNMRAGSVAGRIQGGGYLRIAIDGNTFAVHRIIWLLHYGRWPEGILDHANGNKLDNRIENLREATRSQNNANARSPSKRPGHLKGTTKLRSGGWQAQIRHERQQIYIGSFPTAEEAHAAYLAHAKALFGEFARAE